MLGRVENIEESRSKEGSPYWIITISGRRYTVWDGDLIKGLQPGENIEFFFVNSGGFRKVVALHKASSQSNLNPWLEKGKQIARMSCLRTAAQIVEAKRLDPTKKATVILKIAGLLETYVLHGQMDTSEREAAA